MKDLSSDELVFEPPDDLDALALRVMARGRHRRHVRRRRWALVGAMAILTAVVPMTIDGSGKSGGSLASGRNRNEPGDRGTEVGAPAPSSTTAGARPTEGPSHDGRADARVGNVIVPTTNPAAPPGADLIAFVSAGDSQINDIFLHDAARGTTVPLTTHPSVDSWPTWSPDGRRLAFYSDRDGAANLYTMNADGSRQRRITELAPGYQATQPAWSPDGALIAFTLSYRPAPYASVTEFEEFAIWVIEPDGSNPRPLIDQAAQAAWSPDGRRLAYVSEDELNVTDLATGVSRTLVAGFVNLPTWSPDGRLIAYQQSHGGRDQIYVINADGSNPRHAFVSDSYDYSPSFSPDGTRLVFRHDPDGPESVYCENFDPAPSGCRGPGTAPGELWVVDLDGKANPRPLIDGRRADDFLPRFAPRPLSRR